MRRQRCGGSGGGCPSSPRWSGALEREPAAGGIRGAAARRAHRPADARPGRARSPATGLRRGRALRPPGARPADRRSAHRAWGGVVVALVLILAAIVTITSVLRLSYLSRREETDVLFLIGVPPSAIRGPFIVEGVLQALAGAAVALVAAAVRVRSRQCTVRRGDRAGVRHLRPDVPVGRVGVPSLCATSDGGRRRSRAWARRGNSLDTSFDRVFRLGSCPLRSPGMPRVSHRFLRLHDDATPGTGRVAAAIQSLFPKCPHRPARGVLPRRAPQAQQCLEAQREYYSARAVAEVERAIGQTMARLDQLCNHCDCDHIVSCVLRKLDQVTNLSGLVGSPRRCTEGRLTLDAPLARDLATMPRAIGVAVHGCATTRRAIVRRRGSARVERCSGPRRALASAGRGPARARGHRRGQGRRRHARGVSSTPDVIVSRGLIATTHLDRELPAAGRGPPGRPSGADRGQSRCGRSRARRSRPGPMPRSTVLVLLSGGASALLAAPAARPRPRGQDGRDARAARRPARRFTSSIACASTCRRSRAGSWRRRCPRDRSPGRCRTWSGQSKTIRA